MRPGRLRKHHLLQKMISCPPPHSAHHSVNRQKHPIYAMAESATDLGSAPQIGSTPYADHLIGTSSVTSAIRHLAVQIGSARVPPDRARHLTSLAIGITSRPTFDPAAVRHAATGAPARGLKSGLIRRRSAAPGPDWLTSSRSMRRLGRSAAAGLEASKETGQSSGPR
jgi:hypothetical protein